MSDCINWRLLEILKTNIPKNFNYDLINSTSAINEDHELFATCDSCDPDGDSYLNAMKLSMKQWISRLG